MLSDKNAEILRIFRNVSLSSSDPRVKAIDPKRFQALLDDKLIDISRSNFKDRSEQVLGTNFIYHSCDESYTLSSKGEDALAAYDQMVKDKAENKRQQRFDNKIAIATVLVPLITFVLGLVVEHFSGIMSLFFSLFSH